MRRLSSHCRTLIMKLAARGFGVSRIRNEIKQVLGIKATRLTIRKEGEKKESQDDHSFQKLRKRFRLQNTKTRDCPAFVTVREIFWFPEFKIPEEKKHLKEKKSADLRLLMKTPAADEVKIETKYLITAQSDHNHELGEASALAHPVDDRNPKPTPEELAVIRSEGIPLPYH